MARTDRRAGVWNKVVDSPTYNKAVDQLARRRVELRQTKVGLARVLNIGDSEIDRWETHKELREPRASMFFAWAERLGYTIELVKKGV